MLYLGEDTLSSLQAGGGSFSTTAGFRNGGPAAAAGTCNSSGGCGNMAETMVLFAMGKLAAKLDRSAASRLPTQLFRKQHRHMRHATCNTVSYAR